MADEKRLTNELTLVGKLISISDIVERGKNATEIITVRIEQPGKFTNVIDIEFFNDKIDDVLDVEDMIGMNMRIRASVNGRIWKKDEFSKEMLFLSVIGWSIKLDETEVKTKDKSKRAARKKKTDSALPGDAEPGLNEALDSEMPGGDPTDTTAAPTKRRKKQDPDFVVKGEDDTPF